MNEEEARERCKQIIKDNNEVIKEARKNRDINSMQLTASLDNDSIAIETVLNLLEKKDKIIDYMAEVLADYKYEELICMEVDCEHIELQNEGKCIGDEACIKEYFNQKIEKGE